LSDHYIKVPIDTAFPYQGEIYLNKVYFHCIRLRKKPASPSLGWDTELEHLFIHLFGMKPIDTDQFDPLGALFLLHPAPDRSTGYRVNA
jgi:hypothetical protein